MLRKSDRPARPQMTRPHAKPRGDAPAPPPRGRPDEPSAPPPPFDTPPTTAETLEAHREMVDALEKELKQASIDAGMSEVRVAFAREILDHAEREHQANVLRYDSVMVALQEANRTSATSNGGAHEPPAPPDQEHRRQPNRRDGGDQGADEPVAAAADEAPRGGPDGADLRRVVSEADDMQRSSAVLRSKLEAQQQREQARAARRRREELEAAELRRREEEARASREAAARPPPAPPFVQRNRSEPLPEEDFCSPEYHPMRRDASWSSDGHTSREPEIDAHGSNPNANQNTYTTSAGATSDEDGHTQPIAPEDDVADVAREELRNNLKAFLPKVHVPREGLTPAQLRLGPGPGELCVPGFCSAMCVASAAVGFVQYASPGTAPVDPGNVPGIIKSLRKIAIRNHPDRNSVAKVGENQAAKAKVITAQATNMESLLDEFEHVNVRVHVDVPTGPGEGPSSATSFVLNRLHLGASTEQLMDLVLEERPELRSRRDGLAISFAAAPGRPEMRLPIDASTLRSWEVSRASVFRVWVPAPDWMAFES